MENATIGIMLVTAKVENLYDLESHQRGLLAADQIRSVEVSDALVDSGAMLSMPKRLIAQLGLFSSRTRQLPNGCCGIDGRLPCTRR